MTENDRKGTLSVIVVCKSTIIFHSSSSQTFWSQDPFTLLKIIEDTKELLFMWIISVNILPYYKLKLRILKNIHLLYHFKSNKDKPMTS